jgi:hypothetical protein
MDIRTIGIDLGKTVFPSSRLTAHNPNRGANSSAQERLASRWREIQLPQLSAESCNRRPPFSVTPIESKSRENIKGRLE